MKFKFHPAWKLRVRTHIEFRENEFFEFKLKYRDEFTEFWLKCFKYLKFYRVRVPQKYKPFELRVACSSTSSCHLALLLEISFGKKRAR